MTGPETITGQIDPDLKPLYLDLMAAKLRETEATADLALLQLQAAQDKEIERKARAYASRHLVINDVIMSPMTDAWIDMLDTWERTGPGQDITVSLNSPGGQVTEGFALYDTICRLQRGGTKVTIRAQGFVASMAAILFQVGDERIIDANATLMIHELSSSLQGKISDIMDAQAFMTHLQDRALAILASKSKLSKTQIARRWKRKDDYLSAEEAVKLGFADRVE